MNNEHSGVENEVLDRNVEALLSKASLPPSMDATERREVLAKIKAQAKVEAKQAGSEAGTPPARQTAVGSVTTLEDARRRKRIFAVAGGALALAAAVLLAIFVGGRRPSQSQQPVVAQAAGEQPKRVSLQDGSYAILGPNASIEETAARAVEVLAGPVYFDVRRGKESFVVHTPHGTATAVGTRFVVNIDGGETLTTVIRGAVSVQNSAGEVTLAAGQSARLGQQAPVAQVARRLSYELAWAKAELSRDASKAPVSRGTLLARVPEGSGSGEWALPMRTLDVDVVVQDGVARTTIDQTFFNETSLDLEGVYRFPLPTGAAISQLVMYVDGQRVDGAVVERSRARNTYERIVYRRLDPALVEWMRGNEFQMRVFPLPARQEKRLVMSYTQALPETYATQALDVPLPALDVPVGTMSLHVQADGVAVSSSSHGLAETEPGEWLWRDEDVTVERGIELRFDAPGKNRAEVERRDFQASDDAAFMGLTLRPSANEMPPVTRAEDGRNVVIAVDTSASRTPADLAAQRRFAVALMDSLGENDRLALLTFDTAVRKPQHRRAGGSLGRARKLDLDRVETFLRDQSARAAGGTNLGELFDEASTVLADANDAHLIVIGDGLTTLGDRDAKTLSARLAPSITLSAVTVGETVDQSVLAQLSGQRNGIVASLSGLESPQWQAIDFASRLSLPRLSAIELALLDAQGKPLQADLVGPDASVSSGSALRVWARATPAALSAAKTVRVRSASHELTYALPEATPGGHSTRYLARLWAQGWVSKQIASDDVSETAQAEIVALATEHFLLTPYTSLLVLENDAMFRRFGIKQRNVERFAPYELPKTIPVVHEPLEALDAVLPADVTGILKSAPEVLSTPGSPPAGARALRASAIGMGNLGLIGTGRGGGGTGSGYGRGDSIGLGGANRQGALEEAAGEDQMDARQSVDLDDLAGGAEFSRTTVTGALDGKASHGRALNRTWKETEQRSFGFRGVRTRGGGFGWWTPPAQAALPVLTSLSWSGDPRLDDITNFVPGMLGGSFDLALRGTLERLDAGVTHRAPDGAVLSALERARASNPTGRFEVEQAEVEIDGRGRIWSRSTPYGALEELTLYDGEQMLHHYPQLGLSTRRVVGAASPLLLQRIAPMVMPPVAHLTRLYDVESVESSDAATVIRLRLPGQSRFAADIGLDTQDRIVFVRGPNETEGMAITYGVDTIHVRYPGQESAELWRRVGPAGDVPTPSADVTLTVPFDRLDDAERTLQTQQDGVGARRRALHDAIATAVALNRNDKAWAWLMELARTEELSTAELVIASGAVDFATKTDWKTIKAAYTGDDAILRYLEAAAENRGTGNNRGFGRLASASSEQDAPTLVGMLASYRDLLDKPGGAHSRLTRFVKRYDQPILAYAATLHVANNNPYYYYSHWGRSGSRKQNSAQWVLLVEEFPEWEVEGMAAAGNAAYYEDYNSGEAAQHYTRSIKAALDLERSPIIDYMAQNAVVQQRGQATFDLLWNRYAKMVRTKQDTRLLAGFVTAATTLGRHDDIDRALRSYDGEGQDPAGVVALVDSLRGAGRSEQAWRIVEGLEHSESTLVLDRRSRVAEDLGRTEVAAESLEELMRLESDSPVPLTQLREDYGRLIELHGAAALGKGGSHHIAKALDAARSWRSEDPGNPDIERRVAALLWDDQPDLAYRHLTSIIDRLPADGSGHATVAAVLSKEGDLDRAHDHWQRAREQNPEDPTHAYAHAQVLLALGRAREAKSTLETISKGTWQPRFSRTVWQAKQTLRGLGSVGGG